ncbi:MAG TPA: glyoxalase/bleomycin resistance/extradiol dioxygenase family protein [Dyella sp.]|uniref:VOC family protein n=1 Tax=Dyella sp. TaxID=1869338 RepID=UPI002B6E5DF2|nr:glyoxalase/bleomycin resistance/extradiol dioxygenase family protein [Dyella sp.]HUB88550.1 glyoxalase/bleomycin resistance/extradiol dioxygenase family protein [Dyella sp.]
MYVQPYLFFNGRCEEAIHYYEQHLGAKVNDKLRYKEAPPSDGPAANANGEQIMYSNITIGDTVVMASDDCVNQETKFQGFSLSLTVTSEAEAERAFAALADGGQVNMPLGQTFFSPCFGMVIDRFGVNWMVIIPPQQ